MDRRFLLAIVLLMLVAVAPSILLKKPVRRGTGGPGDRETGRPVDSVMLQTPSAQLEQATPPQPVPLSPGPSDTVLVTSGLYSYGFSTRGGRLVSATLPRYRSMAPGDKDTPVQLVRGGSDVLGIVLVVGQDTIPIQDWDFTPSAKTVTVGAGASSSLTLSGGQGGVKVELIYRFTPDDYRIGISGKVSGVGPNGGLLLIGMGDGLRQTEADSVANQREFGVVTMRQKSELTRFSSLKPDNPVTLSGPFQWVAVKSKYFVLGALAFDSSTGQIGGVTAAARQPLKGNPTTAVVRLSMPIAPEGLFELGLYAGPMEYPLLARIGHDFDDVNPYGWPGFRTVIRPVAVAVRWLLVWMHSHLHLAYGVVLVMFGIMVRLILWPLNQKAMRASMAMQAIQPLMKDLQDRYKDDPTKLQQEMFKLYRDHKVNPFGGCWPLLIPMPVLFALFFVFQNTIELRGASFLWLPDLARADPLYVLPVLMGLSMYGLSKVGQIGMEPNPQMKMMLYVMPVMMTVLFAAFASGLNLYYTVSNLASIPQQWFLAKERLRRKVPAAPAPPPKKSKK
jgi:YidC/Oxa1 family membrane protein insertase